MWKESSNIPLQGHQDQRLVSSSYANSAVCRIQPKQPSPPLRGRAASPVQKYRFGGFGSMQNYRFVDFALLHYPLIAFSP